MTDLRQKPPPKPSPARHAAWLLPLIVCASFALLITGGLTVRHVVLVMRQPAPAEVTADSEEAVIESMVDSNGTPSAPNLDIPPSSEPGFDVLPPAAARHAGRVLPKMLVVGAGPGMFPSIREALSVAIRGDIVEIRGEGPFWLSRSDLIFEPDAAARPLVIRAGREFRPVLRVDFPPDRDAVVDTRHVDVTLEGLHFVSGEAAARRGSPYLFRFTMGNLTARGCSLSKGLSLSAGGAPRLVSLEGANASARVERCFFRSTGTALLAGGAQLQCEHCGWLNVTPYAVELGPGGSSVDVRNSSFFASSFLSISCPPPVESDLGVSSIAFHNNVFVSPWAGFYFAYLQPPEGGPKPTRDDGTKLAFSALERLAASDNLVQFWEGTRALTFAASSNTWPDPTLPLPTALGPPVKSIAFGPRLSAIGSAVHRGEMRTGSPEILAAFSATVPADLMMQTKDPATAALLGTGQYGADPRLIADPPPLASEPFESPPYSAE